MFEEEITPSSAPTILVDGEHEYNVVAVEGYSFVLLLRFENNEKSSRSNNRFGARLRNVYSPTNRADEYRNLNEIVNNNSETR